MFLFVVGMLAFLGFNFYQLLRPLIDAVSKELEKWFSADQ